MAQVYICNTGVISAIGNNTAENLTALLDGTAKLTPPEILQTIHTFPVGEIKMTNAALATKAGVSSLLPRTALLSILAAQEAWAPFAHRSNGLRIALISANTVGGMDITEAHYEALSKHSDVDYAQFANHECGAITNITAGALSLNCFTATISTACSSSANTIMMASKLILKNQYDVVIAGGADALSKFTLNGFNALMVLDKEICKPFNENRQGLNLGEGAAYLVLANKKATEQWNIEPVAVMSGYANANDAHHQTASSPDGTGNRMAMEQAIKVAGITIADIDYINLHGTGTVNNDAAEGTAITALFNNNIPHNSSTKTYTGHTLGAAGAIEAVFSYLSIKEQIVWPHLRMHQSIKKFEWQPTAKHIKQPISHVLSNSFGFGGNCSALVISKK